MAKGSYTLVNFLIYDTLQKELKVGTWQQGWGCRTRLKRREIRKFVIKKRQALVWHVISLLAWSKPAPWRQCHQQGLAQVSPLNLSQQSLIWTLGLGSRLKLHLEADNRDMGRWGPGGVGRGGKRQSLFLIWLSTQGWTEVVCHFFFFGHLPDRALHLSGLEIAFLTLILSTEDICPRIRDVSLWSSSDLEFFSSFWHVIPWHKLPAVGLLCRYTISEKLHQEN